MNSQIQTIEDLIKFLPKRDIDLGYRFLKGRDFESLQELVDSALIKTKKNIHSDNPREEYLEVDIDKLSRLKAVVDSYYVQLSLPEPEPYDNFNDFDDDIEEEEFY